MSGFPCVDRIQKKTKMAFIWTSILNAPFWVIFNLLPFILYKDLSASPLQITIIVILKPAVSLIALYWSTLIKERKDRLISNLIWGRILSHLPFFFFPFVDNPWFFIASFGLYMTFSRGMMPAWMEVLKLNATGLSRSQIYAYGSSFGHICSAILPLAFGTIMDRYTESWRLVFPVTAFISLTAVLFKWRIPIALTGNETLPNENTTIAKGLKQGNFFSDLRQNITEAGKKIFENFRLFSKSGVSIKQQALKPWKDAFELIKRRPDYARFQLGFMLGGSGLIIIQPILPSFFMNKLHLSYTELAAAIALCKGIGYLSASSMWARIMNRIDLYRFNSWVTFIACLCPLCFLCAQSHLMWLYGGYLLYGIMQAGSEMSWHLSGPVFSKEEDSSVYSSVNVLTAGLRGCFVPIIGSMLGMLLGITSVMMTGALLCLLSTVCMRNYSNQVYVPQSSSRG